MRGKLGVGILPGGGSGCRLPVAGLARDHFRKVVEHSSSPLLLVVKTSCLVVGAIEKLYESCAGMRGTLGAGCQSPGVGAG